MFIAGSWVERAFRTLVVNWQGIVALASLEALHAT
jgi:hypothetical protein